jgi:hypothetical protein
MHFVIRGTETVVPSDREMEKVPCGLTFALKFRGIEIIGRTGTG